MKWFDALSLVAAIKKDKLKLSEAEKDYMTYVERCIDQRKEIPKSRELRLHELYRRTFGMPAERKP